MGILNIATCTIIFLVIHWTEAQELPLRTPSVSNFSCFNDTRPDQNLDSLFLTANDVLDDQYGPECGVLGWNQVASINMSEPNSQCPSGWTKVSSPITACTRGSNRVASATFSTGGTMYSNVCGRVIGYQHGETDAFGNYISEVAKRQSGSLDQTIEGTYCDGVSITHGSPPSRQHIWSFAAGESGTNTAAKTKLCPCSSGTDPNSLPPYIGTQYFCDSGNFATTAREGTFYGSKALWSGQGCASTSRCCEFNGPPWFYVTLAEATNNDLEVRLLDNLDDPDRENVLITIVDLYTK